MQKSYIFKFDLFWLYLGSRKGCLHCVVNSWRRLATMVFKKVYLWGNFFILPCFSQNKVENALLDSQATKDKTKLGEPHESHVISNFFDKLYNQALLHCIKKILHSSFDYIGRLFCYMKLIAHFLAKSYKQRAILLCMKQAIHICACIRILC